MNMRGKANIDRFGPSTLEEINNEIREYAKKLGLEVEFFHSNIEGEVINALYDAHDRDIDAVVMNPAGFLTGTGPLPGAIAQVRYPVIEVHVSNPMSRGTVSTTLPACKGSVLGFGNYVYFLGLEAAKHLAES